MAKIQRKIGIITEVINDLTFKVDVKGLDHDLTASISGKIKLMIDELGTIPKIGDRVLVEYSPYDTSRGRIHYKSFIEHFWDFDAKYYS